MRNIAILEWGPPSLYYVQCRERIKVRTEWLEDGPALPAFLSTEEEAKSAGAPVRYALSAYEDLNVVIRNLRKCFGFPYQESIGYLNTMTRKHRARREHEGLVHRLRQWAIFGNVDAVVWVDYEKSNHRPSSFRAAPKGSRPFSDQHVEVLSHVIGKRGVDDDDDESEGGYSSGSEAHGGGNGVHVGHENIAAGHAVSGYANQVDPGIVVNGSSANVPDVVQGIAGVMAKAMLAPACLSPGLSRKLPFDVRAGGPIPVAHAATAVVAQSPRTYGPLNAHSNGSPLRGRMLPTAASSKLQEKRAEQASTILQDEAVPCYGSYYARSMVPGPGAYGCPTAPGSETLRADSGRSFGHRPRGRIDDVVAAAKSLPGPGEYGSKPSMTAAGAQGGSIGRAVKQVELLESQRKFPYISSQATEKEGFGMHSPAIYHHVRGEAVEATRGQASAPRYSFGVAARPW